MMTLPDRRPCQGDAFEFAGPRLRGLWCENCKQHKSRGGKCLGTRGYTAAWHAKVKLRSRPCAS